MLTLTKVNAGYGAIQVLKELTLEVGPTEIVALLGANGAGKSTTLLTIAGVVPVRGGQITWQDEPLPAGRANEVLRRGICLCPEGRHIFPRLTVHENLISGSLLLPAARNPAKLDEVFHYFPLLAERRKQLGGTLSGGEQQMLAIGRALMGEPKLLMLDEPSLGLAPQIVARIFEIIRQINQKGVPILLVEQNAQQALRIANRGYVIVTGKNQLTGTGAELLASDEVRQAYLGE
jgi:branched-chain amino acid transport system ATP-binding protein